MNTTTGKAKRTSRKNWAKMLVTALAVLVCIIGLGFVYEWVASLQAKQNYPPPGKLVDVGGFRLHVKKIGIGSPTIVFEAGSRESSHIWRDIPEQLAKDATVVTYDRAGYSWSEQADTERTGNRIVQELHTALQQEGIRGPYILVGHSQGGMYSRLFAQQYRDEVAGLVLLDARPEQFSQATDAIFEREGLDPDKAGIPPTALVKLLKASGAMRLFQNSLLAQLPAEERPLYVNVDAASAYLETAEEEDRHMTEVEEAIRDQQLGSLPVRIVTHAIPNDATAFGMSAESSRQLEDIWQDQQKGLLDISTDSELIIAQNSGHMIMHDEPDLVVEIVQELLAQHRN
ncbi:alpha/beta fold hydrolase [Paenibacillus sp. OSY-SE]|uniref:alpha/beta fold hydrolase n=1 Tax=Paenibacillus sp. OSY-SE TaxID=1196323 RepID=UPI000374A4DE|nr:alpha/beta hydrolase [Paenibacillus sp. OSY-SE]